MLSDDTLAALYTDDLAEFERAVAASVPADAVTAATAQARRYHALRVAAVTAAYEPYRLGKGKVGGGRFAKRGDLGIDILRKLLRGNGSARKDAHAVFDKKLRANDGWGRGDLTPANLNAWATKAFGPRPHAGNDALAWDAGRRELGTYLAAIPARSRMPQAPDAPGDGSNVPDSNVPQALTKGARVMHTDGRIGRISEDSAPGGGDRVGVEFRDSMEYVPKSDLKTVPDRGKPGAPEEHLDAAGNPTGRAKMPAAGGGTLNPDGSRADGKIGSTPAAQDAARWADATGNAAPRAAAAPTGDGTRENPYVTDDVAQAAAWLAEDKHVRLNSVEQVSTLLDKLHAEIQSIKDAGGEAPNINLCNVSVPGTNLFCAENVGKPRIQMPQLSGKPIKGSPADGLPKDPDGGVDLGPLFIEHLRSKGIRVTEKTYPASHLRASQNELLGNKVLGMMKSVQEGRMGPARIFTSNDQYVVDGHHRWAANVGADIADGELGNLTQDVNEVDAPILDVLAMANAFALQMGIPQADMAQNDRGGAGTHIPNIQPLDVPEAGVGNDRISAADADAFEQNGLKPTYATVATAAGPSVKLTDDDFTAMSEYGSAASHIVGRNPDGSPIFTPERQALHQKIVDELTAGVQPSDNPIFYMLGGGPAAGKSTMLGDDRVDVPGEGEVVTIDSDAIKGKLPEYQQMVADGDGSAASFAHEESSYLAKLVMATSFERNLPTLLDGTGDSSSKSVQKKIDAAHAAGYRVQGMYATVPTQVAIDRADARAAETGRVVPHSVIEGTHASVSAIFPELAEMFDDLMLFENSDGPNLIAEAHGPGTLQVHDQGEWKSFLAKGVNSPHAPAGFADNLDSYGADGETIDLPGDAPEAGAANDLPDGPVPTTITRDAIMDMARNDSRRGQFSVAMRRPDGTETQLEVIATDGNGSGYAESRRTGMLYRFEQTGSAVKSGQVTVKVTPAEDTGDVDGTLSFDGASQRGRINQAIAKAPGSKAAPEAGAGNDLPADAAPEVESPLFGGTGRPIAPNAPKPWFNPDPDQPHLKDPVPTEGLSIDKADDRVDNALWNAGITTEPDRLYTKAYGFEPPTAIIEAKDEDEATKIEAAISSVGLEVERSGNVVRYDGKPSVADRRPEVPGQGNLLDQPADGPPTFDPIPNIPADGMNLADAEEAVNERLRTVGIDPGKLDTVYAPRPGFEGEAAIIDAPDIETADGIEEVLKGSGLDYTRRGNTLSYDGYPAPAPRTEVPGQGDLLTGKPIEARTATDLLDGDTSPDHIREVLKRGDLTDAQRAELRRLLPDSRTDAVAAALSIADRAAARRREAAVTAALELARSRASRVH